MDTMGGRRDQNPNTDRSCMGKKRFLHDYSAVKRPEKT
jgi:hypothetical protein